MLGGVNFAEPMMTMATHDRYTVTVPWPNSEGDVLTISLATGENIDVIVPPGLCSGDSFEVIVERQSHGSSSTQPPLSAQTFEVIVPANLRAGQCFDVTVGGGTFEVRVPHGTEPGDVLLCDLPVDTTEAPQSPPLAACADEYQQSASSVWPAGSLFAAGERVEIRRSDGSLSLGTVTNAYEGVLGRLYQVCMDNGVWKQAVSEDELYRRSDDASAECEATDSQARTLLMWQEAQMACSD